MAAGKNKVKEKATKKVVKTTPKVTKPAKRKTLVEQAKEIAREDLKKLTKKPVKKVRAQSDIVVTVELPVKQTLADVVDGPQTTNKTFVERLVYLFTGKFE